MQKPATPPRRTCPSCNRPVEPGYKFCETCGTHVPELFTCSKCGTQFIDPGKYCDLCGTPFTRMDGGEMDDSRQDNGGGNSGPAEDPEPDPDEEEIPEPDPEEEEDSEPDPDDSPEVNEDEDAGENRDEIPHHHTGEIPEPGTDELLEEFGKEYAEDETLGSRHAPSPEPAGDALFLTPESPKARAKPPVNVPLIIGGCILLLAVLAVVYFIGLPILNGTGFFSGSNSSPVTGITPVPTITGTIPFVTAKTTAPLPGALVPQPTQLVPSGQKFYFQVQKNPVTLKIAVLFLGSAGEGSIRSADVKVTHPDGSVATGIIQPLKGVSEIYLDGSKETDRVEIVALMSSGGTYRVFDELVPLVR